MSATVNKLSLADDYLKTLKDHCWLEGTATHMYLDYKGYVTVGIGHLLANVTEATKLTFNLNGKKASKEEIEKAYNWVRQQPKGETWTKYHDDKNNNLSLRQEDIDRLAKQDIEDKVKILTATFGNGVFNTFPKEAQRALLDICFNVGSLSKFSRLKAAVIGANWSEAAYESYRRNPKHGGDYARNTLIATWFCQLAERHNQEEEGSFCSKFKSAVKQNDWNSYEELLVDLRKYQSVKSCPRENSFFITKVKNLDKVFH